MCIFRHTFSSLTHTALRMVFKHQKHTENVHFEAFNNAFTYTKTDTKQLCYYGYCIVQINQEHTAQYQNDAINSIPMDPPAAIRTVTERTSMMLALI